MKLRVRLAVILALLCFVGAASAATYMVTNAADSGARSLRQALADAADQAGADTVIFGPGMSGQTITLVSTITVNDQAGVSIDSTGLPAGVTISGNHGTSILSQPSASSTLTLRGLTLMNGYDKDGGGAIGNSGTLTLVQCMLSGNSAPHAGAIKHSGGTLTLTQCVLSGNSANSHGGAIYNVNASTLMQCTFSGNSSHVDGGAIYTSAGNVLFTQCTLYGNSAGNGYSGGALYNSNSAARLTHCTLSGNSSSTGGAIFNSAVLILANSIVAGNSAGTGPDLVHAGSSLTSVEVNFIGKNYTMTSEFPVGTPNVNGSYVGTNNSPLNARLAPLGNHGGPVQTMALLPGSLARDHASILSPAITRDQRGFPIIDAPDIGAYEAGTTNTFAIALCGKTAL